MVFDTKSSPVQEVKRLLNRAKEAQAIYSKFTQEQVDYIIQKVSETAYNESARLGKLAVEETGMGVIEHKQMKNELCSKTLYESIKNEKTVGIVREDYKNKIIEIAAPFGIVACIIPTTNPTSTAIFKTLIALKTLNAIVVSPHPTAAKCTVEALRVCNEAAVEAGAPEGLINWIAEPTLEATTELMQNDDTNLILATGGAQLVRAAYSSGKPAYGVGPGNVPVYIEKTAGVKTAVKRVVDSKTFDNGTICSTEQAVVVDANIKQMAIREFNNNGAYFLNESEKVKIENVISPTKGQLNSKIVGKSAKVIAQMAGVMVPDSTRLLMAEENRIARDVPLSIEKLSPILPIYIVHNVEEAKETCFKILDNGGKGHTMSLHSNDDRVIKEFGLSMPVSRLMVNTLSSIGAAGATSKLMPSMTLGCGSFGGNITSDNITARHLINIKKVASGTKEVEIPKPSINWENINDATFNSYKQEQKKISNDYPEEVEEIVEQVLQNVGEKAKTFDKEKVTSIIYNAIKNDSTNTSERRVAFSRPKTSFTNENNKYDAKSIDDKVTNTLKTTELKGESYNINMIASMVQEVIKNA